MAKGDTKTNQYLDIAANGTRSDFPTSCCETRSQTLIREVGERIMDLEDEVERLENNPDVADIVATYADLQSYDTSQLTDKDVIRVLQDETHDGDSTYYRWSTATNTWTYIGESKQYTDFVGTDGTTAGAAGLVPAPATTDAGKFLKADGTWADAAGSTYAAGDGIDITNDVISATNTGLAKELTVDDYNYPTNNPDGVALWLLGNGLYHSAQGVKIYYAVEASTNSAYDILVNKGSNGIKIFMFDASSSSIDITVRRIRLDGSLIASPNILSESYIVNNLTSTNSGRVLSAAQGKVLKDFIGDLTNLTTTDKTNLVAAINEAAAGGGGGPTVVQTTGTSTTDVMSQNAVTGMIFADPATQYKIKIGAGTSASEGKDGIEIGHNAAATKIYSTALGVTASASGNRSTAIGQASFAQSDDSLAVGGAGVYTGSDGGVAIGGAAQVEFNKPGAIALGAYSSPSAAGEMNIGSTNTSYGYNSSNYRLLTGVYDGQSAHDAVTVGQVNSVIDAINTAMSTNIPHIGA